jgi:ankyrin repeat protein
VRLQTSCSKGCQNPIPCWPLARSKQDPINRGHGANSQPDIEDVHSRQLIPPRGPFPPRPITCARACSLFHSEQIQSLGVLCAQDAGDTPLHLAAAAGNLNDSGRAEVLAMLLGLGASADLPNKVSAPYPFSMSLDFETLV